MAKTVIGLFKREVIGQQGPWKNVEEVEFTTLTWVDWLNNRRLLEPIDDRSTWMPRGEQAAIPTPGQNQKRYIAGALHAHTGNVVWVDWESKNSLLFIRLLYDLKRTHRAAKRLVLILDNYRIHKSHIARHWLANNPKVTLLFQPTYHP